MYMCPHTMYMYVHDVVYNMRFIWQLTCVYILTSLVPRVSLHTPIIASDNLFEHPCMLV